MHERHDCLRVVNSAIFMLIMNAYERPHEPNNSVAIVTLMHESVIGSDDRISEFRTQYKFVAIHELAVLLKK